MSRGPPSSSWIDNRIGGCCAIVNAFRDHCVTQMNRGQRFATGSLASLAPCSGKYHLIPSLPRQAISGRKNTHGLLSIQDAPSSTLPANRPSTLRSWSRTSASKNRILPGNPQPALCHRVDSLWGGDVLARPSSSVRRTSEKLSSRG